MGVSHNPIYRTHELLPNSVASCDLTHLFRTVIGPEIEAGKIKRKIGAGTKHVMQVKLWSHFLPSPRNRSSRCGVVEIMEFLL
jgi:hypothetical protein